ncbi:MAG TPA: hypothetical protein PLX89_21595 [Verrucomicrobiota bacterium]|nr:hypothetical protein [Verrucomicrobiota bacterium]
MQRWNVMKKVKTIPVGIPVYSPDELLLQVQQKVVGRFVPDITSHPPSEYPSRQHK